MVLAMMTHRITVHVQRLTHPHGGVGTLAYFISMFVVFLGAFAVMIALRETKPADATPAPAKTDAMPTEVDQNAP